MKTSCSAHSDNPFFAPTAEALMRDLEARNVPQAAAAFVDPAVRRPYQSHLSNLLGHREWVTGRPKTAVAAVVAVVEDRIEVKGRSTAAGNVGLCWTEWYAADR